MTRLSSRAGVSASETRSDSLATVEAWLRGYDAAGYAKDLEQLAVFYHPDVTIKVASVHRGKREQYKAVAGMVVGEKNRCVRIDAAGAPGDVVSPRFWAAGRHNFGDN